MTSRDDIIHLVQKDRDAIRRFGVSRLGVFGSFARGDHGPESDIDILVELQPERETFDDYMGLLFYLEKLFGRKVDLVMKDTIKPLIRDRILRETVYVPGF
jgi:predicted nucleotidyltransferase